MNLLRIINSKTIAGGYPNNAGPDPANPGGLSRGDCVVIDNFTDALCFAFRTDNSGPPQSVEVIVFSRLYKAVRIQLVSFLVQNVSVFLTNCRKF